MKNHSLVIDVKLSRRIFVALGLTTFILGGFWGVLLSPDQNVDIYPKLVEIQADINDLDILLETSTPTITPTLNPTIEPTIAPTPTTSPTAEPTIEPTIEPTPEQTIPEGGGYGK